MSNQVEYFQHLVDTCDNDNIKGVLMEQLQKEQKRVAKKRVADRLAREQAEAQVETPTQTDEEDKPKRGRKPKQDE